MASERYSSRVLGIDIGGSSIKSAPVDLNTGELLTGPKSVAMPEPSTPDKVIDAIGGLIKGLEWKGIVGVGYPGVIKRGRALSAANVSDEWLGVDICDRIASVAQDNVYAINDADGAGMAEMHFGAGKDHESAEGTVLMITLGTGIGTAFFHKRQLFPNTEFGHVYMENGIEAEDQAAARIRVEADLDWQDWGDRVNWYLQEMYKLVSPDLVIVGGGISENFEKFEHCLTVDCAIVPAKMRNDAGIIGAALAGKQ